MTVEELKQRLRQTLGGDNRFLQGDLAQTLRLSGAHHFEITDITVEQTHRGVTAMVTWEEGDNPEKVVVAIQC